MSDTVDFKRARVEREEDARKLSVADVLSIAAEDAKDGRWTKCLLVLYREDDEMFTTDMRVAGCSKLEARGLMLSEIKNEFFE